MRLITGGSGARALVVGVDRYDLDQIPALTGAVADALEACKWLIDIGVNPAAIDLHLSTPSALQVSQLTFAGQQLQCRDATWKSVWTSLYGLKDKAGERLFVFLSGHGLSVPPAEPVFLLQDYGVNGDWSCNLGLNSFVAYFLSLDFEEQFLICDACENFATAPSLRSAVLPRQPPNYGNLVIGTGGLIAVHSASPGQRAFEDAGRGLMMSRLLAKLDPAELATLRSDDSLYSAISFDWDKAEWALDLQKLVDELVGPEVSEAALTRKGARQDPRTTGEGARKVKNILRWTRDDLGEIVVEVDPSADAREVEAVRLVTLEPTWSFSIPDPSSVLPRTLKLPVGIDVTASARGKSPERPVEPLRRDVLVKTEPSRVVFRLSDPTRGAPSAEHARFNVRIYGEDGTPRFDAGPIYANASGLNLERIVRDKGFTFEHHEHGPDISLPVLGASESPWTDDEALVEPGGWDEASFAEGERLSYSWAELLRERLGGIVIVTPPGIAPEAMRPNLVLHTSHERRLLGYLAPSATILVRRLSDDEIVTTVELAEHPSVQSFYLPPDLYELGLDLPWGRWRQRLLLKAGDATHIELPCTIGQPPLRNGPDMDPHAIAVPQKLETGRLQEIGSLTIASCPGMVIAVNRAQTRVEPISEISHPAWDAVFTAQRLDLARRYFADHPLERFEAESIHSVEWDLLHLLNAYTRRLVDGAVTDQVVAPLLHLAGSLDALLLSGSPTHEDAQRDAIARLWRDGRRPLLRWGYDVILACGLAEPQAAAGEASRQLPGSAWTALRRGSQLAAG